MKDTEVTEDDIIVIPIERLQEDVLNGIIDEFVLQEGTDYGQEEYSLLEKREQVRRQILDGRAQIVFNQKTDSCSIIPSANRR
ncbi:MAG: YheU family protein [Bdellovibrionota bacterium]|jgi:uncharacterized protein YheU (UPF0270 family)